MASTLERRNDNPERVPLRMAVELGDGDFRDPFAASVCNVSKGGISMRATCLPDIGSRLMCRFRCMPSNTLVTVQGEIVWAHLDGENCGEFGLAFLDLDPKSEWLIEEMIAEHAALSRDAEAAAPVATLELEGSAAPIEARLSHKSGGRAVFEQQLDLLKLGRGVRAHADGRDLLAGSIASVELKMVGAVPMLTVTVAFQHGAEVAIGDQIALPVHDTEPDLSAPPGEHEFAEPRRVVAPERSQLALQVDQAADAATEFSEFVDFGVDAEQAALDEVLHAAPVEQPAQPPRVETRAESQSVAFRTARAQAVLDDDAEFEAELDAVRASVWKPLLTLIVRQCSALLAMLRANLQPAAVAAGRAALPVVRGGLLRTGSRVRTLYRTQLAPQLGALRRVLAAQFAGRRRRVTAGPAAAQAPRARASLGRTLVLGMFGAGAVGLAVYALVPTAADDELQLHRKVRGAKHASHDAKPAAEATEAADTAPAAAVAAAAANSSPGSAPASVAVAKNAAKTPAPGVAVAAPGSKALMPVVPAAAAAAAAAGTAPAAATPAADAKLAAAPRKLRFGAARVPGGRQFSLRMSGPIRAIEGSADRGGFTIIVSGCLSLDRAGPIASAHKSVSRAMVINKGDHAELSVRFSDGKQPAYSVSADGSTLYITIQDA